MWACKKHYWSKKKLNNLKHNNEARARIVEDIHDAEYRITELLLTSMA